MHPLIEEVSAAGDPELLVEQLRGEPGIVLLRSALFDSPQTRYSFVTARPFLVFRSYGSRCELSSQTGSQIQFGNPWRLLESLMPRYELLDALDLPFPLGGCFGYWGYDLKNFLEPRLPRRAVKDLALPDCHVGFYDSLVVFDHRLERTWIVSTGLCVDGSRREERATSQADLWKERLSSTVSNEPVWERRPEVRSPKPEIVVGGRILQRAALIGQRPAPTHRGWLCSVDGCQLIGLIAES